MTVLCFFSVLFNSRHKKDPINFNKFWRRSKVSGRKSNGEVLGKAIEELNEAKKFALNKLKRQNSA